MGMEEKGLGIRGGELKEIGKSLGFWGKEVEFS